jgi:hypothetical protein
MQQANQVIGHEFLNLLPSDEVLVQVVRGAIPIFVGERNSRGGLSFKCPVCNRKHHHKAGTGFRVPHCFAKPPVHSQAYYLLELTDGKATVANVKRCKLESTLKELGGKMFSIDYVKRNGEHRSLTGRLSVTAPLKGGENKVEAPDRPYLTVYDIQAAGYRTVNLDTTVRVRVNGRAYNVVD